MQKNVVILVVLLMICMVTSYADTNFLGPYNVKNNLQRISLIGILALGVSFVIISGGIDLSIGSVVGLIACLVPYLLQHGWSIPATLLTVLLVSGGIGLIHGLLITKAKLQPFIVTLCGLLIYRGIARWFTADATQGLGENYKGLQQMVLGTWKLSFLKGTDNEILVQLGKYEIPNTVPLFLLLAAMAIFLLNFTVLGRYLKALGFNEQATRYSGVNTDCIKLLAYIWCSLCAGLGGFLYLLDLNSVQPSSFGNFYELYAIAAAVLGGCSLRGGEGSVLGVMLGSALLRVITNAINFLGVSDTLEFAVIGLVILLSAIADESLRRLISWRRAVVQARSRSVAPSN